MIDGRFVSSCKTYDQTNEVHAVVGIKTRRYKLLNFRILMHLSASFCGIYYITLEQHDSQRESLCHYCAHRFMVYVRERLISGYPATLP